MLESDTMMKFAVVLPNETPLAFKKPVPVTVTWVPPPVDPVEGFSEEMVGAATAVYV
jgi:hypothetical protein